MKRIAVVAVALGLAACATPPLTVDRNFGEAVRMARAQQTLNPEASRVTEPVVGLDGAAAKEAVGRYQDSFKSPPPTMNVINIGGSMTSGGN